MNLFHDWFLRQLLGLEFSKAQSAAWTGIKSLLVDNALAQPRVFVHRDYHSRNLMRLETHNPGILDFQDAVRGPLSYDLVSLLRDCYVDWPPARVRELALEYHAAARGRGLTDVDAAEFLRWFDLMGAQRHLKAIGIFSRLKIRDGKAGYIGDIPRTFNYLRQVAAEEEPMAALADLIDQLELEARVAALGLQA